ncbi:hypothetical protein FE257_010942 [Aspergillus nanangensis]|uniref:NAD(P)-binding protein n=1 Tax=Aspergillus nanangensis TaxID=2582783 RepID=A0AAD4CVT2_ASPNN|nr:hypothetical protein FE257_010942 [Aspergillus nanangensis]
MDTSKPSPDFIMEQDAFTRKTYRDVYPAINPTRPELSQVGKVVVITGASRGLGRLKHRVISIQTQNFATSFARANAGAIALLARDTSKLAETEKLVREISPATKVLSISVDITDEPGVRDAFRQIVGLFGTPHVLINNAGVMGPFKSIFDEEVDSWWRTQEMNVRGTLIVTKAFLAATGPEPKTQTTIINLSSAIAHMLPPGLSSYSITKLVMTKLATLLSAEHPTITTVSVNPGMVSTDLANSLPMVIQSMKDMPELCGGTAVWLASGDKSFLSGRFVDANWDVEELEARKEEIQQGNLLTIGPRGKFGKDRV